MSISQQESPLGSQDDEVFVWAFTTLQRKVHKNAKEKGFWEADRNVGEAIALMHSELSEALEGYRSGNPESDKIPGYTSAEEELADVIIRICDFAEGLELDVAGAVVEKHLYNCAREYKHGRKF